MLPIVVVLTCFILLWGMVNYSSFVAKKKQVADTFEARKKAQIWLGEALMSLLETCRLHAISIPNGLLTLPALTIVQPKSVVEEWGADGQNLLERAKKLPELVNDKTFQTIATSFEEGYKVYLLARKRHRAAINAYNWEAKHMPSKIIARLFHFRPV